VQIIKQSAVGACKQSPQADTVNRKNNLSVGLSLSKKSLLIDGSMMKKQIVRIGISRKLFKDTLLKATVAV